MHLILHESFKKRKKAVINNHHSYFLGWELWDCWASTHCGRFYDVPPDKAFRRRPCSWFTLTQSHVCFLHLCNRDACVSQLLCYVCVGEQMCCCAADVAFNLRGNEVISIPRTRRRGTATLTFWPRCQTHAGTGSTRWGGSSKHPQLFNFGCGLGWNYILVDHIIHVYAIPAPRSRLWWNVIAFKARAVRKCLHIQITSFGSLSSLKL